MTTNNGSYSYAYVPYTYTSTTASMWDDLKQNKFYPYTTTATASDCSGFISFIIDKMNEHPLYNALRTEDILDGYATWRRAADDLNTKIEFSKGNSLEVSDELRDFIDELGGE